MAWGPPSAAQTHTPFPSLRVEFTSLAGETVVAARFIGALREIDMLAVDGRRLTPEAVKAEVKAQDGVLRLILPGAEALARVRVTGDAGVLDLARAPAPNLAPPAMLWPRDGLVDVENGRLVETFALPAPLEEPALRHPMGFAARADERALDVVAVQRSEVALMSLDQPLVASDGALRLALSAPGMAPLHAAVPAWSYRLSVDPAGEEEAWRTVRLQVTGLLPGETATFAFLPDDGEAVEPRHVLIAAGQAHRPLTVARFKTDQRQNPTLALRILKGPLRPPPLAPEE
ncbi:MAG: hypothetical protein ACOY99_12990 [Pseudomonadota bacterium]